MRAPLRLAGLLIAVGFMCLSFAINWLYGAHLGRNQFDRWVFSGASVLADIAKAVTPFIIVAAVSRRQWMPAILAAGFWVTCTVYSLSCVAGFLEINRAVSAGGLANQRETEAALRSELGRKQTERDGLGSPPAVAIVTARIDVLKQDRRWISSSRCSAVSDGAERKFCASVSILEVERAQAQTVERVEPELQLLRQRISALSAATALENGDPRVSSIQRISRLAPSSIEGLLSLLFLVLLEIGSGLGLYIAIGHGHAPDNIAASGAATSNDSARPVATVRDGSLGSSEPNCAPRRRGEVTTAAGPTDGDVGTFALECLHPAPGSNLEMDALVKAYGDWRRRNQLGGGGRHDFQAAFVALAKAIELKWSMQADKIVFADLMICGSGVTSLLGEVFAPDRIPAGEYIPTATISSSTGRFRE